MTVAVEEIRALLGKQVKIVLDREGEKEVVSEGKLIEFDDAGGFVLLDEMGFRHYGWPMLEIMSVEK